MLGNLLNALNKFFWAKIFQFLKKWLSSATCKTLTFPYTNYTKGQQSVFFLTWLHSVHKLECLETLKQVWYNFLITLSEQIKKAWKKTQRKFRPIFEFFGPFWANLSHKNDSKYIFLLQFIFFNVLNKNQVTTDSL